jgi:heat shock protein HslJ
VARYVSAVNGRNLATAVSLLTVLLATAGCGGDDDGEELASLEGTSWALVEGAGVTIPEGRSLNIGFEADSVSGSGGCNRFTGGYQEDGDSISIGPLAATRMACAPPIMDAEQAYLAAVESASAWSATADQLVLSAESGDELLRFRPANVG